MKTLFTSITIAAVITFTACNKNKQYSKRLSGETWHVTELTVDGTAQSELPELHFEDCDIYKESCKGSWENHEGGHSHFIWQFREKGEKLEISNQSTLADSHGSHADEEAILQCSAFSGVYDVTVHKKDRMEFETTSAIGFSGNKVVLKMEKH